MEHIAAAIVFASVNWVLWQKTHRSECDTIEGLCGLVLIGIWITALLRALF
jgi:hypothetical protein